MLPIRVGDGDVKGIPKFTTIVPDARNKTLNETVALIIDRLRFAAPGIKQPGEPPAQPQWPNEPTPYEPGLADRLEQWPVIQQFMTEAAAKRILIFKGPSGYSKSALLNAAARYAKILRVPTGYVDFKDASQPKQCPAEAAARSWRRIAGLCGSQSAGSLDAARSSAQVKQSRADFARHL